MLHSELAAFAARFHVSIHDAYVLPALFEVSAQKAGMQPAALLAEALYRNAKLGDYLAGLARGVAEADRADRVVV